METTIQEYHIFSDSVFARFVWRSGHETGNSLRSINQFVFSRRIGVFCKAGIGQELLLLLLLLFKFFRFCCVKIPTPIPFNPFFFVFPVSYNELAQVYAVWYLFCPNSGWWEQSCICIFIYFRNNYSNIHKILINSSPVFLYLHVIAYCHAYLLTTLQQCCFPPIINYINT